MPPRFTGKFEPDRASTQQHDPASLCEVGVHGIVMSDSVGAVEPVGLRREGVRRASRQDQEVAAESLPGGEEDPSASTLTAWSRTTVPFASRWS